MHLLCVGDVALAEEGLSQWAFPGGTTPGEKARVLFNWELPIGDTINPIPRTSGPRLLAHPDSPRVIQEMVPWLCRARPPITFWMLGRKGWSTR